MAGEQEKARERPTSARRGCLKMAGTLQAVEISEYITEKEEDAAVPARDGEHSYIHERGNEEEEKGEGEEEEDEVVEEEPLLAMLVPLFPSPIEHAADGFTVGKSRKSSSQVQGDQRCSHHHLTVRCDAETGRSPGYHLEDHSHNGTWLRRNSNRWLLKGTRAKLQHGDIISLVSSYKCPQHGPECTAPTGDASCWLSGDGCNVAYRFDYPLPPPQTTPPISARPANIAIPTDEENARGGEAGGATTSNLTDESSSNSPAATDTATPSPSSPSPLSMLPDHTHRFDVRRPSSRSRRTSQAATAASSTAAVPATASRSNNNSGADAETASNSSSQQQLMPLRPASTSGEDDDEIVKIFEMAERAQGDSFKAPLEPLRPTHPLLDQARQGKAAFLPEIVTASNTTSMPPPPSTKAPQWGRVRPSAYASSAIENEGALLEEADHSTGARSAAMSTPRRLKSLPQEAATPRTPLGVLADVAVATPFTPLSAREKRGGGLRVGSPIALTPLSMVKGGGGNTPKSCAKHSVGPSPMKRATSGGQSKAGDVCNGGARYREPGEWIEEDKENASSNANNNNNNNNKNGNVSNAGNSITIPSKKAIDRRAALSSAISEVRAWGQLCEESQSNGVCGVGAKAVRPLSGKGRRSIGGGAVLEPLGV